MTTQDSNKQKTNVTTFTQNGKITPDKKKIQKFDSAILLSSNKQAKQNPTSPARDTLALHKPKPSNTQEREQKDEEK